MWWRHDSIIRPNVKRISTHWGLTSAHESEFVLSRAAEKMYLSSVKLQSVKWMIEQAGVPSNRWETVNNFHSENRETLWTWKHIINAIKWSSGIAKTYCRRCPHVRTACSMNYTIPQTVEIQHESIVKPRIEWKGALVKMILFDQSMPNQRNNSRNNHKLPFTLWGICYLEELT